MQPNAFESLEYIKLFMNDYLYELNDRPGTKAIMAANIQHHLKVIEDGMLNNQSNNQATNQVTLIDKHEVINE